MFERPQEAVAARPATAGANPGLGSSLLVFATVAGGCAAPLPLESAHLAQRMVVSADMQTTPENEIWLEAGIDFDPSDRTDTPVSVLYGAGPRTELFFEASPFSNVDTGAGSESGVGDLVFGVRQRLLEASRERPGVALHFFTKVPTAEDRSGIGTGEFDFFLAGSVSREFEPAYVTAYYELGILGEPDASTAIQHLWAVAAAQAWTPELGGVAELVAVAESDRPNAAPLTLTGSVVWTVSPRCALDLGVVLPLDDDAGDPRIVAGVTLGP